MRCGCKTDEEQSRVRIAEARHRPAPVRVVAMRAFLLARDALTVLSQARTAFACHDRAMHVSEPVHRVPI